MKRRTIHQQALKPLLIGALGLTCLGLFLDLGNIKPLASTGNRSEACEGPVNAQVSLSREQLAQFLTVSERDTRERVVQIVGQPYCQLSSLQVRAGVTAERQVYPLAFDPQTRLVILYEGNEYAGYRFNYQ